MRVSVNTNDYITVRSNQFSEVLNINPAAARTNYSGKPRFIEHFSNQFLLRLDKRTRGEELLSSLNPFSRRLDDSLLVTMNSSYRNMFFINRNDPVWGMDYTWQQNRNKSFLSNGFESRTLTTQSINGRWNMSQHFQLSGTAEQELRENNSEYFKTRNWRICKRPGAAHQLSTRGRFSYYPFLSVYRKAQFVRGHRRKSRSAQVGNRQPAQLRPMPVLLTRVSTSSASTTMLPTTVNWPTNYWKV